MCTPGAKCEVIPAMMCDFPKVQCPFLRQTFSVDLDGFKRLGSKLKLRNPEVYLAVNRVNPGFEWVFEHPDTVAVEKLDGSNIKLKTEKGRLVEVQNRLNVIDPLQILSGKVFLMEGVFQAIGKGYVQENGEQSGELIGPKLQGNPYKLDTHIWYPFKGLQRPHLQVLSAARPHLRKPEFLVQRSPAISLLLEAF